MGDDIDWGSSTRDDEPEVENNAPSFEDDIRGMQDEFISDVQNDLGESIGKPRKQLSYKGVAFILGGVLILLVLIFMFIDRIHFTKRQTPTPQAPAATESQASGVPETQASGVPETQASPQTGVDDGDTAVSGEPQVDEDNPVKAGTDGQMYEISPDTVFNYNAEALTSSGVVHDKVRFLSGSQVVYDVKVVLTVGSASQLVDYYCGYDVYNSVEIGDSVKISYQQVMDGVFSVNNISK